MPEPTEFPEIVSVRPSESPYVTKTSVIDPTIDRDISARVHELLMLLVHPVGTFDRRVDRRYAYPYLVRLTATGPDGKSASDSTMVVVGKSLSEHGFGFYHQQPLENRRVIASFHAGDNRWLGLLLDLRWCRFAGQGWYESGGRFIQAVTAVAQPEGNKDVEGRK